MDICRKAEKVKTGAQDKPLVPVKIIDCGELKDDEKLNEQSAEFLNNYSLPTDQQVVPEDKRVEI